MERIYVDHAATSPMHPKVIDKMMEVMNAEFGNPSSIHSFGRGARHIIDEARTKIAKSIGAQANELIFTSGGTEADNHAIFGVANSYQHKGKHIITTQIEHHAVLHTCEQLEKRGFEITYLPVDQEGRISLDDLENALRDDTILVTIMYGNNEVGTIQPIKEIGQILKEHPAIFHTDAVQAYGIEKIDVKEYGIDLMSVSAHKMNGPKGIGFLYAKTDIKLASRVFGGEQERKRRAGTENVPSIAGFLEAVRISQQEMDTKREAYLQFKAAFIKKLSENNIEFRQNGSLDFSLPHVLNLSFPGTNVEAMLVNLDLAGIAASSGSACTAGSIDPSHVLVAMFGKDDGRVQNSIRFSFGLFNTLEQIEKAAEETSKIVKRLTT
ncbi:cysteine desulfurase family protein [Bacillus sp. DTU_2020_1000418_1_SI_GHA_SEK_038]|uniref:cysteine desulfurase family protein n=1 Tax=Bacillus sp. DTU_2020_1000418_1_SI_GHA_SEK_038 TaxID=3077585 RepID=UPI0028E2BFBA|nr:cysteine desulfurase family protein [Bacillus sp. DTU_2020_1000418_1_SI_GHA_SEK_038]WNS74406.1 cysteine desulfurase family protein [Bacillus sp. DTU_2020_1000418_1_SI_GHA_SEK_038]